MDSAIKVSRTRHRNDRELMIFLPIYGSIALGLEKKKSIPYDNYHIQTLERFYVTEVIIKILYRSACNEKGGLKLLKQPQNL